MDQEKTLVRAKNCAYRLLSYRSRSIKEINDRLKKKGFSPAIIKKTVTHLKQINYLNDEEFAKSWVRT
ncbi:MAG: regulatory protein RecX, partial [Candidatus Omnitrophica bacterium]|nr:regulatory protein RecX [Candidatus Omnitrophota bacterium]